MEKEAVSIIVPVYNTAIYLRQCLESILAQTLKDIEIVCVNDGSTDESPSILEEYARRDARIRVVHKANGGLVSARKAGLAEAKNEFIGFVDSDDWIDADMYRKMLSVMRAEDVDCVVVGHYISVGQSHRKATLAFHAGRYDKETIKREIYPDMIFHRQSFDWGIFPHFVTKLFRKSILGPLLQSANETIDIGEDQATVFPYLLEAKSIFILSEYYYYYRQNTLSMTKNYRDPMRERKQLHTLYQDVLERLRKYKNIYNMEPQWKRQAVWAMMQRADILYENIEQLDFLYPFSKVRKGMRIILYGAGFYGQRVYHFLKKTEFCSVVAWVDQNYKEIRKTGLQVDDPSSISNLVYDAVVITITFPLVSKSVFDMLSTVIDKKKIHMIDIDTVFSQESIKAFHLN